MIKVLGAVAVISALALVQVSKAGASNIATEPSPAATPHQELTAFLLRGPADPARLAGKRIAMIIVNGADAVTLKLARDYLVEQGATVDVLTPRDQAQAASVDGDVEDLALVRAFDYAGNMRSTVATALLEEADPTQYAVIYLPGNHPDAQSFEANDEIGRYVTRATAAGTPIFAIGDAALLLSKANLLRGGHATAARNIQPFLVWSGVDVYDEPVVRDDLIYTSRDAFDLPRLMNAMVEVLTSQ